MLHQEDQSMVRMYLCAEMIVCRRKISSYLSISLETPSIFLASASFFIFSLRLALLFNSTRVTLFSLLDLQKNI